MAAGALIVAGAVTLYALSAPDHVTDQREYYRPANREAVITKVPRRTREERAVRAASRRGLVDEALAVSVARQDIERARALADPRFLGRARATLARWWQLPEPPPDVLLLRATIEQSLHDFPAARRDLDQLVRMRPADAQAQLTRAVVATVTGDYPAARQSCGTVADLAGPLIATACTAPLDALRGHTDEAYERLADQLQRSGLRDGAIRSWITSILAELAIQQGDWNVAKAHLRTVLAADPNNPYARGLLADVLLALGDATAASVELAGYEQIDGLLVRRAIAEARANGSEAPALAVRMRQRFDAARATGYRVHLREEARFVLEVERDPARAVTIARQNWAVQHELADARILAAAALASRDGVATALIVAWATATGVHDAELDRILQKGGR